MQISKWEKYAKYQSTIVASQLKSVLNEVSDLEVIQNYEIGFANDNIRERFCEPQVIGCTTEKPEQ